jgi:hypothetical protein
MTRSGLFVQFPNRIMEEQGERKGARQLQATAENARDYWRLFVNRRAYIVQSPRPHPKSGRHYYFRPNTGSDGGLTEGIVRQHLEGRLTIGLYAMNPKTQRSKWIAIDGDYRDALKHLCELQWELQTANVEAALEMSRRGAHLWILAERPLLARECRLWITRVAQKLGIPVKGSETPEGIELFPKHDELKEADFGNAIRGPLGIHRAIGARYWFYGADYSLDKQLTYLKRLAKLSEDHLRSLVGKASQSAVTPKPEPKREWHSRRSRDFRILDHVEVRRRVGRNWIARCPSCAAAGRDTSKDNLAISVDEPQKYICWAGCTRDMIRAALGVPAPRTALAEVRA